MAATKIKSLSITGLRGVKESLAIPLDQKSAILYGDNGTGKSSITDAVEWFYYGRIEHLADGEIGKLGLEALRNITLPEDKEGLFQIEYSNNALNCVKNIGVKKAGLKSDYSNKSETFINFLKASQKENLIIRYKELVKFILSTKSEKLADLSEIIGFAEVTNTRTVLKKALNDLSRELKNKNFEGSINIQQDNLLKQLQQNIPSETHFINALNQLIAPLKLEKKIEKFSDIDDIVTAIKKPTDNRIIEEQSVYTGIKDFASNFKTKINVIHEAYTEYEKQFRKLTNDADSLKKIFLSNLLIAGKTLLQGSHYTDDNCPLCVQPKNTKDLLKEILGRIEEIQKVKAEQQKLDELKTQLDLLVNESIQEAGRLLKNKYLAEPTNTELKEKLDSLKSALSKYTQETSVQISTSKELKQVQELKLNATIVDEIETISNQKNEILKAQNKDNKTTDIVVKIELSKTAFKQIEALKKAKEVIEKQKETFDILYVDFVKKQKKGLESFINNFSGAINEYYQFMNPDEPVQELKLVVLENEDELVGITVSFKFFGQEVSPPHKYFSESHLNCFGIAFFLASVKAFNRENKFILMDDVISSFDANHRKRFADLLIEKFSNEGYQIILLTHEKQWFDYVKSVVQNKNWMVNEIKWSDTKGTYIDETNANLRQRIEQKISNNIEDDLGNNIRKYLEHILKTIAFNLEVRLKFLFNDTNENRMSYELLSELKSKIKANTDFAKHLPLFERTLASTFIGNKDSHDSSYTPSMGDLKAFWKDVKDIEELFYCSACLKFISLKYYDEASKKVKCKCGAKEYSWNK